MSPNLKSKSVTTNFKEWDNETNSIKRNQETLLGMFGI